MRMFLATKSHGQKRVSTQGTSASDAPSETDRRLLLLSEKDNVCVALAAIEAGEQLMLYGQPLRVSDRVPMGHKIATRPIVPGEKVIKYGAPIGSATCAIASGQHVHTHNLKSDYLPTYTLDGDNPFLEKT